MRDATRAVGKAQAKAADKSSLPPDIPDPLKAVEKAAAKMPMAQAKSVVLNCATQAVMKYVKENGCEDYGNSLSLGDVFDAAYRKNLRTWRVNGRDLNKTQIQSVFVNLVAEGEYLPALCKVEGMPNLLTVMGWLEEFPDFAQWMRRAEAAQAMLFMYEAMAIADGATPKDSFVAKLRIDTRTKMGQLLDAKKWSPKHVVQVELEEKVSEQQLQDQVRAMLLSNADRYFDLFGIIVVRREELPKLVLREAEALRERGVEVAKTADFVDTTFSMNAFKEAKG